MANEKIRRGTPFTSDQSRDKAAENGRKGGIASGESKRRKRSMKDAAQLLMGMSTTSEKNIKLLSQMGIEEDDLTNQMAVMASMLNQALKGNVKAAVFIRDLLGENPAIKSQEKMHRAEMKQRREEFEYRKAKDAGETEEIEDLDDVEADIYGDQEEADNPLQLEPGT